MKIRDVDLKRALEQKHSSDFFLTEVKNGPTGWNGSNVRMDAIAINKSWSKPCIYGYEIKVDRQDFLNDEKWPIYREQTHRFSFVCPKGLIQPDEVAADVGLIWYNPETGGLYTRKKAIYREVEMSAGMLFYIIMTRLSNDRYPFFSEKEAYMEAYLEHKAYRRELGKRVGSRLTQDVEQLTKENNDLQKQIQSLKEKNNDFDKMIAELNKAGFSTSRWSLKKDIAAALSGGIPRSLEWSMEAIVDHAKKLDEYLKQKKSIGVE